MSRHTDFYRACPFVHHFVDAHLENLIGVQRTVAKHNAMVEVIRRTVPEINISLNCPHNAVPLLLM